MLACSGSQSICDRVVLKSSRKKSSLKCLRPTSCHSGSFQPSNNEFRPCQLAMLVHNRVATSNLHVLVVHRSIQVK